MVKYETCKECGCGEFEKAFCDECGKFIDMGEEYLYVEAININGAVSKRSESEICMDSASKGIDIRTGDPEFCSKACLVKYISKLIDEAVDKKKKKAKKKTKK